MAFNLADVLGNVSNLGTDREQIEYIDIDLIDDDPNNFYELSELDELAGNIELLGLQQPLRVRPNPEDPNRVIIVSGHRRRAAIRKLVEDGKVSFREIACIREQSDESAAMQELRLIFANSNTRKMSSADQSKQAQRVEELLYQLKEEGVEFPGRMRDHVAQACQMSKSKLARLKVIRENLYFELAPLYESGELKESVAYALAKLDSNIQRKIYMHKHPKRSWTESYIADCVRYLDSIHERWQCDDSAVCTHRDKVEAMLIGTDNYEYPACNDVNCCKDCYRLESCKNACPRLSDEIAKHKADKKEAARVEREQRKAKDAPLIEAIENIWKRFGELRAETDTSVESCLKAMGIYYSKNDDVEYEQAESLQKKFKVDSYLPFGWSIRLREIQKLIRICDLFGCSLDYLLCRTDVPKLDTREAPAEGWLPLEWIDGREKPAKVGQKAVAVFRIPGLKKPWKRLAEWNGRAWVVDKVAMEDPCLRWFPIPEDE